MRLLIQPDNAASGKIFRLQVTMPQGSLASLQLQISCYSVSHITPSSPSTCPDLDPISTLSTSLISTRCTRG